MGEGLLLKGLLARFEVRNGLMTGIVAGGCTVFGAVNAVDGACSFLAPFESVGLKRDAPVSDFGSAGLNRDGLLNKLFYSELFPNKLFYSGLLPKRLA